MDNSMISTTVLPASQAPVFTSTPTTWDDLAALEPRLADVAAFVRLLPRPRTDQQWEQVKARIRCFVGWHARNPRLRTSEAYDLAYRRLRRIFEGRGSR